ncbi:MAG: glycosyltransferase family 2 protein [Dethiobacter sp.]|nr:glycosyltransferase family 2 protein [Dethiobacter sp.]
MARVSVIMTSYNKPEYVGKSIESILKQTLTDFELLLMDDNSNKKTKKVIGSYLNDKRIKYYCSNVTSISERAEKIRYAVQINKALSMATGQYISYATDDNIYRPQRLEKMVNTLESNPEIKIVYSGSKVLSLDKNGEVKKTMHRMAKSKTWLAPCTIDHCSIMHRADILPTIYEKWNSYWDEDPQFYFIGDARFFWRLNHFWPFHPINEVLDDNYITKKSLHGQMTCAKKNRLIRLLPEQRTCKELRDYLRNLGGDK